MAQVDIGAVTMTTLVERKGVATVRAGLWGVVSFYVVFSHSAKGEEVGAHLPGLLLWEDGTSGIVRFSHPKERLVG
jgi:hypothetical protein